jgi:hypothetical protein
MTVECVVGGRRHHDATDDAAVEGGGRHHEEDALDITDGAPLPLNVVVAGLRSTVVCLYSRLGRVLMVVKWSSCRRSMSGGKCASGFAAARVVKSHVLPSASGW